MWLSKSRFIAGWQCLKRLYLEVHQPELVPDSEAPPTTIVTATRLRGLLASYRELVTGSRAFPTIGLLVSMYWCRWFTWGGKYLQLSSIMDKLGTK
jgi:hypothetical protein